jgi:Ca2+/Na+ antiporter
METVFQIFLLAAGFTMLIKGADFFVDGSSGMYDGGRCAKWQLVESQAV